MVSTRQRSSTAAILLLLVRALTVFRLRRQLLDLLSAMEPCLRYTAGNSSELSFALQVLFNLARHRQEAVLDADAVTRRSFEEGYIKALGEFLALLSCNLAFLREVHLVSDEDFANILCGKPVDLLHPLTNVLKGVPICHIIYDNNAVGAAIVTRCQRAKALLTGRVPNLQLDHLLLEMYCLDFEVDTNRVEEVFVERVVLQGRKETKHKH